MSSASTYPPNLSNDRRLAEIRERFLTAESVEPNEVRNTILASWWRSRRWNVAADHIDLAYVRDPELDSPLTRSALPVLRHLREHLDGQPISIILTDAAGVVLTRLAADHDLDRHLDSVQLAPGFSYAEGSVGTNGIGTALEGGQPAHVFGHEHYAENLENLGCAGVPIQHPISGKTIGAVDLTCWRKDAGPLLITLAKTTADQIRQALLTDSGVREFALLREYLRACRHTAGIVFALNHDVVMMNEYARQVLDPADQTMLLGQAAEMLASRRPSPIVTELPTGIKARLYCRPVNADDVLAGGVVHVKLVELAKLPAGDARVAPTFLPGLVGSGPLWLRGCQRVDACYEAGEWLALEGEQGVGKMAVARAVYRKRNPTGRFHVLDAVDAAYPDWLVQARRELLETEGSLVIRHLDRLDDRRLQALSAALRSAHATGRQRSLWVVVTLNRRHQTGDPTELLRLFPSTIELPPLRHHIEDLHELVPFFLAKFSHDGQLACTPETMQLLLRSSWPGNVEQLRQVLRRVVQHRRTGLIHPDDLPPECRTVSRRLLSPIESMERDAIVQSLLDCEGHKAKAARSLGMSRATIYRKIHEYGIVTPSNVPGPRRSS
ncbi:GAF domain-containing protein [Planosporangium flavigriseum]|uniref:Fis family transcriptional regulator n=1 Tax=Planosporangium flavigriseum TaxID=373681 RepID=A0A8J3LZZ9_9ACTN|nr:GAF domain-containing protein [Planosporangium flavigriseum]NJC67873.1 GAF domain-containing protein [Planosporangium flavigriseum]GIG76581.1 Fis family transcriptional regulator [Planosporangium flavigriseum]